LSGFVKKVIKGQYYGKIASYGWMRKRIEIKPMRGVLLIDDDIELTEMLAEFLSLEGFEVSCAYDGESGAQKAISDKYEVVVLDVMLPKLNGFDALTRIRQQSQVPIIMLTAKGDGVDRIIGLEMGADDYLPKPCNPRELVARI
jgi:DNA-binding response OmpR family regulator